MVTCTPFSIILILVFLLAILELLMDRIVNACAGFQFSMSMQYYIDFPTKVTKTEDSSLHRGLFVILEGYFVPTAKFCPFYRTGVIFNNNL